MKKVSNVLQDMIKRAKLYSNTMIVYRLSSRERAMAVRPKALPLASPYVYIAMITLLS